MKELIIGTARCTLILQETELFQMLADNPSLFEKAIGRGKGYRRSEATEKRQSQYKTGALREGSKND